VRRIGSVAATEGRAPVAAAVAFVADAEPSAMHPLLHGARARIKAQADSLRCVHALLDAKADVNCRDLVKVTPLHKSAANGRLAVACALVLRGAHLDARDAYGDTALHRVAWNGQLPLAKLLLSYGCPVDTANHREETSLHFAALCGDLSMLKELIRHGASLLKRTSQGLSVLHVAVRGGSKATIEALRALYQERGLLWKDAITTVNRDTPVHIAIRAGHVSLIDWMIQRGARAREARGPSTRGAHQLRRPQGAIAPPARALDSRTHLARPPVPPLIDARRLRAVDGALQQIWRHAGGHRAPPGQKVQGQGQGGQEGRQGRQEERAGRRRRGRAARDRRAGQEEEEGVEEGQSGGGADGARDRHGHHLPAARRQASRGARASERASERAARSPRAGAHRRCLRARPPLCASPPRSSLSRQPNGWARRRRPSPRRSPPWRRTTPSRPRRASEAESVLRLPAGTYNL
jgi:hypothetical protein